MAEIPLSAFLHFLRLGFTWDWRLTRDDSGEEIIALHYMYYNFARISLRVTPAMEARVSDHVWSLEEIIALI